MRSSSRFDLLPAFDSLRSVDRLVEPSRSLSINGATGQTISRMASLVGAAQSSPVVMDAARQIARECGLTRDRRTIACAVWSYVHSRVRFVPDEELLAGLGMPNASELLIAPWLLLSMSDPRGDCDDFSVCVASLLSALQVPCAFVTVAADASDKARFSHVYVEAILENGQRFPLDASHGEYAGWEVPHPYRRMSWPLHSAPVTVTTGSRLNGLGAADALEQSVLYGPRPRASRMSAAGRRGLGDSTSIDWGSVLSQGMTDATQVLSTALPVALAPAGSLVQTPGVTVATGGATSAVSSSGSLLLIGALVLIAVMMSEKR